MKELNSLPVAIADELDSLLILVEAIVAKLLHAEEQQINRPDIIIWIQSLSNAMYEADDLLGEIFTEVVRRPREDGWKNLITCFMASSLSNSVSKMARDLNVMRQKLEDIFNEHRLEFKVRTADFDEAPIGKGNGFGFIPIVGREDDFDSLESHLLGYQAGRKNQSESVVISICGMAGLGKTTLAQRLYHHESIKQHFVLRVWVNASNNFNIKRIVGEMWESTTREKHNDMLGLGQLTRMLLENMEVIRSRVVEARCLLVLDDVWNQDPDEWSSLLNLFKHFDTGSKLLVTTRSQSVVDVTGGVPYHLHGLSTEASERLLVHVVTGGEVTEVGLLRTIDVGKTISICNRNPLAIRMFGRQLANSNDPRIGHFHVGMAEEEDIIKSAVRLTYEELPSRLKLCFGHCSLFPKDSEIQVQTLIHLWIAQGFVRPPKKAEQGTIEDVGYNYFVELMRRSLLQGVKDDLDNVKTFKVCNLMHELASSIAGSTTGTVRSGRGNISECIIIPRHISLSTYFDASMELPTVTSAESLCTIFLANQNLQQSWRIRHSGAILEKASSYACLRALDFHKSGIEKVPASIRNLKVLRYLDLSENDIELLPNTITQMFNLQVLNLSGCELLKRLPSRIEKLVNLRHLYCDKCWNLSHMPLGIGELTCLITLTCFVLPENAYVASRYKAAGLEQLRHLNALRGRFEIRNLGGYIKNVGGTKLDKSSTSFLRDKKGLRSLSLCWGHLKSDHLGQQYDLSLKFLEPPLEIKELMLSEYVGEEFPSWVSSLKNLISLQIRDCHRCRYLPPLEEFPLLKFLKVKNLPELEYISSQGKEKYGGLSSLKKLYIFQCRKLRGWWKEEGMQMQDSCMQQQPQFHDDLMRLEIYNCPKLDKMPLFPSLEEKLCLHNTSLGPLRETMKIQVITGPSSSPTPISRPLSKLKSLRISSIHEAEVPPEDWLQELTSLRELRIKCWALAYLPSEIRRLTSLRELDISYCPRLMQRFAGNKSKDWHHISHIPNIKIDKQMVQLGEIYLLNEVDSAALMEKISVQFVQDVIYFASADVGTSNVSLKAPVLMK
ncbi:Putative disease resistance protein RGA4 [Linum grandiflorum]